ncbi:hypothetical protein [Flavobacterium sp.]|uniref:hypothetical protein n=1 Tax=Flavobacterium sp. TaxID=239 RepID=UPI003BCE3579
MKIKLNSGIELKVEAYHRTNTYAGLILGTPSNESNQRLINQLSYPKDWGNRVCIMKKSDMHATKNVLKPIINSVWLSSSEPIEDKNSFGADLVVMFFSDENLEMTIQEIILNGVRDIMWDKFATDFWI